MPISTAPYTRKYIHTKRRGREAITTCGMCGRRVPRWKTFETYRGFRITDPVVLQMVDRRMLHLGGGKLRVCVSCARFHHIVRKGKSVRKKHLRR